MSTARKFKRNMKRNNNVVNVSINELLTDKNFVSMWNWFKSRNDVSISYVEDTFIQELNVPAKMTELMHAQSLMTNFFAKLFKITSEPFHFAYLMYVQENGINDEQLKQFKSHKHFILNENANAFRMMLNSVA